MKNSAQQYCLRWNNHTTNFVTVLDQLFKSEAFTDVTLAVQDGTSIKCHKMVLAACSTYFQDLFIKNPCEHPIIILSEVKYCEIKAILDYMYKGEVHVAQDQLDRLLKVAEFLKVKGLLAEDTEPNKREETDSVMSPPPAISTSTSSIAHSSGYVSPPHIPSSSFMPYGKSPIERNHNHLWAAAFAGVLPIPQQAISGHQPPPRSQRSILGSSYENSSETSPLSRKKLSALMANRDTPILRNVLGQGQADSSQGLSAAHQDRPETSFCSNSNGSAQDSDRRNSAELSESMMDEDEKPMSPQFPNGAKPGAKPEWKRYKQYTRENIMDAMSAVRKKEMSALQAARRYNVPSRTLYDKLKKAGILPSRSAGIQRQRDQAAGSARFPYAPNVNGNVYGSNRHRHQQQHQNGGACSSALSESESETNGMAGNGSMSESSHHGMPSSSRAGGHSSGTVDDVVMDMSTRSPSPGAAAAVMAAMMAHRASVSQFSEDQVEDLSVGGRSSHSHASATVTSADVRMMNAKAEDDLDDEDDDEDRV